MPQVGCSFEKVNYAEIKLQEKKQNENDTIEAPKRKNCGQVKRNRRYRLWLLSKKCHWCEKELSFDQSTSDHVIARSRGGSNDDSNIVISCGPCNWGREWEYQRLHAIHKKNKKPNWYVPRHETKIERERKAKLRINQAWRELAEKLRSENRGGMYQGGEDALQATCGEFDSHPLQWG